MFVSYIPYDTTVSGVADDLIPLDYIVYYGREDDENDKIKRSVTSLSKILNPKYRGTLSDCRSERNRSKQRQLDFKE